MRSFSLILLLLISCRPYKVTENTKTDEVIETRDLSKHRLGLEPINNSLAMVLSDGKDTLYLLNSKLYYIKESDIKQTTETRSETKTKVKNKNIISVIAITAIVTLVIWFLIRFKLSL